MTVQTTYSLDHNVAYAGMPADQQLINQVSRINQTAATIAFGKGVVSGAVDEAMRLPDGSSLIADFIGIVQYELNRAQSDADILAGVTGVPINRDGTVITDGVVWADNLVDITRDDPVFLRIGATDTGSWSNIVGTGVTLGLLIPNAKWVSTATTGDLARIKFNVGG